MSDITEISVDKLDILKGVQGDSEHCAIARVIERLVAPGVYFSVEASTLELREPEFDAKEYAYYESYSEKYDEYNLEYPLSESVKLPDEASEFIEKFDSDKGSVKPFKFNLMLPRWALNNNP